MYRLYVGKGGKECWKPEKISERGQEKRNRQESKEDGQRETLEERWWRG